ncbi:LytTR family transcriptional regulator DNA-binding domain-containing protein [Flavobacterium sp. AS60]|uniref:LytR/AlgR family response regulator transcription factor n=1 Tax=Flavobacterium anseongense TaxID=2910677 RepID=UPI001F3CEF07|nr:LytTR family DNA-binding domain-containing protein [Flavobacterium sp. AS60]MCF6128577.1 LytTR family transcriptional regulator DNA-binding domain-containing protein [Flavobacterium sp. AS60]
MSQTYIIIDDDKESVLKTQAIAERFRNLSFVASANNYDDGVNLILEHQPRLVFLEIDPTDKKSNLSLALINELYRYLRVVPKIIITTSKKDLAYDALQYEVIDYLLKPLNINDFRKAILKFDRAIQSDLPYSEEKNPVATFEVLDETLTEAIETAENDVEVKVIQSAESQSATTTNPVVVQPQQSLVICVKSYGDYRYIDSEDVLYFEADNNSTDIHLNNGEMITAFKTLKHFETVLPPTQFLRIHNSYIINVNQVSRIHTGNTVCYIKNSTTKLPFSKSYKENVDLIISRIASGNYLEI